MAGKMMSGGNPSENVKLPTERARSLNTDSADTNEQPTKSTQIWDNAINWIYNQSKTNAFLSQQIEMMLDRNLPDRIVQLVDDGNADATALPRQSTDCIKQLLCKTAPFIWSMQRAVSAKINTDPNSEASETNAADDDADDFSGDGDRLKTFFKHLPNSKEFMKHGETCENQYNVCKLF